LSVGTRFGAWAEAPLMPRQFAELGGCGVGSVQSLLLEELYWRLTSQGDEVLTSLVRLTVASPFWGRLYEPSECATHRRRVTGICAQPTAETPCAAVDPVHPRDAFATVDR
jgi:hypothetical protein